MQRRPAAPRRPRRPLTLVAVVLALLLGLAVDQGFVVLSMPAGAQGQAPADVGVPPGSVPPRPGEPDAAPEAWTVVEVVDGDTLDAQDASGSVERVRVIGIDTAEVDRCGYQEAREALSALVLGKAVELSGGARDDRDRYDRLLRYVDVDGVDAGLVLVEQGLAIARYDSRDGYGGHPREAAYVAADAAAPDRCDAGTAAPLPGPTSSTSR